MRSKYIYIKIYTVIIIENYTYLQSCCNFECENMVCVVWNRDIGHVHSGGKRKWHSGEWRRSKKKN